MDASFEINFSSSLTEVLSKENPWLVYSLHDLLLGELVMMPPKPLSKFSFWKSDQGLSRMDSGNF
jgi:hypothetical protein